MDKARGTIRNESAGGKMLIIVSRVAKPEMELGQMDSRCAVFAAVAWSRRADVSTLKRKGVE